MNCYWDLKGSGCKIIMVIHVSWALKIITPFAVFSRETKVWVAGALEIEQEVAVVWKHQQVSALIFTTELVLSRVLYQTWRIIKSPELKIR